MNKLSPRQRINVIDRELRQCVNNPLKQGMLSAERKVLIRDNRINESFMDMFNKIMGSK